MLKTSFIPAHFITSAYFYYSDSTNEVTFHGINGKMSMILIDQTQNSFQLQYSKFILNVFKNVYLCWGSWGRAACYFSLKIYLCNKYEYEKRILKCCTVHSLCFSVVGDQGTLHSLMKTIRNLCPYAEITVLSKKRLQWWKNLWHFLKNVWS